MSLQNNLTSLFQAYALEAKPPIIELQNIDHTPVAALYLEKMNYTSITVSETNNLEKSRYMENTNKNVEMWIK